MAKEQKPDIDFHGAHTYGQGLALDLLRATLARVSSANVALDLRAMNMVTLSTAIAGGVGAAKLLPQEWAFDAPRVIVLAMVICSLCVICIGVMHLTPQERTSPGSSDTDDLHEKYISKTPEVAANKAIAQTARAVRLENKINQAKGKTVGQMLWLILFQIVLLALALVWPVITVAVHDAMPPINKAESAESTELESR